MDERPDRDDSKQAVFTPAPLRAERRPPILAGVMVLATGALVVLGALDRQGTADPSISIAPDVTPPAVAVAGPSRPVPSGAARGPRASSPPPALMALDVRPDGRHVFVNGDVFSLEAFVVVVSLEDRGIVTATRTLGMPGGSTAFLTGANPRFDARFDLPGNARDGALWVRADAYNSDGDLILSLREPVHIALVTSDRAGSPRIHVDAKVPARLGFRPGVYFPLLDANAEDVR